MDQQRRWLFYSDGAAAGPWNMARDEHCLARAAETGRPALRLYAWERPTLSLGRTQRAERDLRPGACRREGVALVRRMTGGRAVLHGTDLTYAVTAPTGPGPFGGGIMATYRTLAGVFVEFLHGLGLSPQVHAYTKRERAELASGICFATPSAFEMLVGGRKLVGSAQRLLPHAFLQHGSLPLAPQAELLARLFQGTTIEEARARQTDLETLGVWSSHSPAEIRGRLARSFEAVLGIELEAATWSPEDEAAVRELVPRYASLEDAGAAGAKPASDPCAPAPAPCGGAVSAAAHPPR
ncbi:MAG: lipoate--protein ligase family protein [Candidatus Lambdaproteobacteria bacterium]|nr:lipoate--protein ligase family protein [Candidatus Lambdaproteobacteria bacterium]